MKYILCKFTEKDSAYCFALFNVLSKKFEHYSKTRFDAFKLLVFYDYSILDAWNLTHDDEAATKAFDECMDALEAEYGKPERELQIFRMLN